MPRSVRSVGAFLVLLGIFMACGAVSAASAATGDYIVVLKDSVADPGAAAGTLAKRDGLRVSYVYRSALKGFAAAVPADRLSEVSADPNVESVEPDSTVHVAPTPVTPTPQPAQAPSNAVLRIGGNVSSTRSGDGKGSVGINVAILDTGIQPDHPDLNVVGGKDCTGTGSFADDNGHGTLVSGFVGARDNAIGRVGIAPGARLWSVKVLDATGFGTTAESICGIDWVTSTRLDRDPRNDIAVANMSFGDTGFVDDNRCGLTAQDALHKAICASTAAGVVNVAAAGNDSMEVAAEGHAPALYNEVLTTSAMADRDGQPGGLGGQLVCEPTEQDDTVATFSNWVTLPADRVHTLAAPGVCVNSTYIGSQYATVSGTSFSAPLVSGTVALCIAQGPCRGLRPPAVMARIMLDARIYNITHPGYGYVGDPRHPIDGRYYGDLIYAGIY
jgi:subtilisin